MKKIMLNISLLVSLVAINTTKSLWRPGPENHPGEPESMALRYPAPRPQNTSGWTTSTAPTTSYAPTTQSYLIGANYSPDLNMVSSGGEVQVQEGNYIITQD